MKTESLDKEKFAKFLVIVGVVFSSSSGILSKLITANAMAIGFYRLSMAMPILFIQMALKKFTPLRGIEKKDLIWTILSGVFLFLHFVSWFACVKYTKIASAVVLSALHPVVVLIALVFIFKRKISPMAAVGICIALVGGGIVAGFDFTFSSRNMTGNLLAISAAINMGIYFLIGNRIRRRISNSAYIFVVFFVCWICFLGGMLVSGTAFVGYPLQDWFFFAAATLLCQFGFHGLTNWSLGYVSSLYVSAWSTTEIIFATILAFIVFGEAPSSWQIIGGLIAIGGLLIYNVKSEEGDLDGI